MIYPCEPEHFVEKVQEEITAIARARMPRDYVKSTAFTGLPKEQRLKICLEKLSASELFNVIKDMYAAEVSDDESY